MRSHIARSERRLGFVHNVIAHPLLVLCPPLGERLHHRTNPLSRWQRNHQTQTIKENTMSDTTRHLSIERRLGGGAVLSGPGVSGGTITDPEVIAAIEQQLNTSDAGRTDTPPTLYTDETPLARVLELLEETASDLVDFASVIQERLNQVLDQRIPAFSDHEQDCRQAESPLVDRLHRLNDTLNQAARVNNGTIARLTI